MKRSILLVDDDQIFGSSIVFGLDMAGYKVHFQTTAINITDVIDSVKPDLLVLDVEIDNINGIELVPMIKLKNRKLPIIFVSSHCETYYVTNAIKSGGEHYLRKPFEIDELLVYIDKYTTNNNDCNIICFSNSKLNIETYQLYVNNHKIPEQLSCAECKLLKLLIADINKLVSNDQVRTTLYGNTKYNNRTINNIITKLRNYISDDSSLKIENIKKRGYMMVTL